MQLKQLCRKPPKNYTRIMLTHLTRVGDCMTWGANKHNDENIFIEKNNFQNLEINPKEIHPRDASLNF